MHGESRIARGDKLEDIPNFDGSTDKGGDSDILATPWQRLWSKTLDLNLYMILLTFIATLIGLFDGSEHPLFSGMVLLPFAMALDALLVSTIGNSIGRMLIGIRVEKVDGDRLTVAEAFSRGSRVYFFGMGIGLPLISFFTYLNNLKKLNKGRVTSWDEVLDTNVYQTTNTAARTWITALVTISIALGVRALYMADTADLEMYSKVIAHEISPSAMAMGRSDSKPETSDVDDPVHKMLVQEMKDYKKDLPQTIDPITTLVDASVEGRIINYDVNVSRRDKEDDELLTSLSGEVWKNMCSDHDLFKLMKDYEVVIRYRYRMPNSDAPLVIETSYNVCKAQGLHP